MHQLKRRGKKSAKTFFPFCFYYLYKSDRKRYFIGLYRFRQSVLCHIVFAHTSLGQTLDAFIGFVSFNTIIIISLDFALRSIRRFFFICFSAMGFHLPQSLLVIFYFFCVCVLVIWSFSLRSLSYSLSYGMCVLCILHVFLLACNA